jgi:hypothetical protein
VEYYATKSRTRKEKRKLRFSFSGDFDVISVDDQIDARTLLLESDTQTCGGNIMSFDFEKAVTEGLVVEGRGSLTVT